MIKSLRVTTVDNFKVKAISCNSILEMFYNLKI